jgi:hypothetical protein
VWSTGMPVSLDTDFRPLIDWTFHVRCRVLHQRKPYWSTRGGQRNEISLSMLPMGGRPWSGKVGQYLEDALPSTEIYSHGIQLGVDIAFNAGFTG